MIYFRGFRGDFFNRACEALLQVKFYGSTANRRTECTIASHSQIINPHSKGWLSSWWQG